MSAYAVAKRTKGVKFWVLWTRVPACRTDAQCLCVPTYERRRKTTVLGGDGGVPSKLNFCPATESSLHLFYIAHRSPIYFLKISSFFRNMRLTSLWNWLAYKVVELPDVLIGYILYWFIYIPEIPTYFRYRQNTEPEVEPGRTGRLF
jgi:hypothetical protein